MFASLSASLALADDFKTATGKQYKNATVSRVEPDGIVLRNKSGVSKVYFVELPKEVQERFHYNIQTPVADSAEQNANLDTIQKRREETIRQRQEEAATQPRKTNPIPAPAVMSNNEKTTS